MSVPNQKIVVINKKPYKENFLQIGISEWQQACKNLKSLSAFSLYLYLAGNMNGFKLELSKEAFANATGFKKTSYHDGLKKMQDLGYLIHACGNVWLFYTTPHIFRDDDVKTVKTDAQNNGIQFPENRPPQSAQPNDFVRPSNIEIDNIDKKNKIDKSAFKPISDKVIIMYLALDKLFPYNVYSKEDEDKLGDLLQSETYWVDPQKRISKMTNNERELMNAYYQKYYEYMLEEI